MTCSATSRKATCVNYVNGGGGFVGIGETAKLEEGDPLFDTLIGLTGATRTTTASAVSTQDVEFLDRVHPATRDLAALVKGRADNYYQWTDQPDRQRPHGRARPLQLDPGQPEGRSRTRRRSCASP